MTWTIHNAIDPNSVRWTCETAPGVVANMTKAIERAVEMNEWDREKEQAEARSADQAQAETMKAEGSKA